MGGSVAEVSRRFAVKGGTAEGPELEDLGPGLAGRIVFAVPVGSGGLSFGILRVGAGLGRAVPVADRIVGVREIIAAVRVVKDVGAFGRAGGAVMVPEAVVGVSRPVRKPVEP